MASVTKRPRKLADGSNGDRWIVRYVDHGGTHRSKAFTKKKDADAYRSQVEIDIRTGVLVPDADKITVRALATDFLAHLEQRRRQGQIGEAHRFRIALIVRVHILPFISEVPLARLTMATLRGWHKDMRSARPMTAFTARKHAQALKMMLDFAIGNEWIGRNPVAPMLLELRGARANRVATFGVAEMRAVLTACNEPMYKGRTPDANLRLQCAVHLAAFCGLRIGEIFGMQVHNVDLERRELRVETSLSRHDGLKKPKTEAGVRIVGLPEHVAVLLGAWIERYQRPNARGIMFAYRDGRPMRADGFRVGSWGPLLVRAKLSADYRKPPYRFHALRHFATSWMIDSGWTLPEVARAIGHSRPSMTLGVYAHALQHRGANAPQMQALSDRLLIAPSA